MSGPFDLAIIGGGINGAALALAAAQAGYRAVLLEKNDFGSGVTSRSTRLIHGGLRYLEQGRIGLVRESLAERERLLRDFPHQVKPLEFLIPVYGSDSRSQLWIRAGLAAYQWIAPSRLLPPPRRISAAEVQAIEPGLDARDLRGGFLYFDAQAIYPERLALEMALEAADLGATVRNHTPVVALLGDRREIRGVRAENGDEFRARLVVSAAGPWADEIRRLAPEQAPGSPGRIGIKPLLSLVGGTHIVTAAFPGSPSRAIYHEARRDRRPFFVIPWRGLRLIGTTETPYEGDPDALSPVAGEVSYLLEETNTLFPQACLQPASILYAYAGARPLLRAQPENASNSWSQKVTREHLIYDHEEHEGLGGWITLLGGKLTTARAFAAQALDKVRERLGDPSAIPRSSDPHAVLVEQDIPARLSEIYGRRAGAVMELVRQQPELGREACGSSGAIAAEIIHAIKDEKAKTVADILLRRTGVAHSECFGLDCAREVARLAAPLLGWGQDEIEPAASAYKHELDRTLFRGLAL